MLANIRDTLLIIILSAIIGFSVKFTLMPEALGQWLQHIDNARFYNNIPIEYE